MRDYFTREPDLTPYTARPRHVAAALNPSREEAPNRYLRRAAELSEDLNLSMYDEAGENLSRVLWLVHIGDAVELAKRRATLFTSAFVALLLLGGATVGRRYARAVARSAASGTHNLNREIEAA